MTANIERYDRATDTWIFHDPLAEGKLVKGFLPNSKVKFELFMLPEGQGFTTTISTETHIVAPGQPAVELWRRSYIGKNDETKFRYIPT